MKKIIFPVLLCVSVCSFAQPEVSQKLVKHAEPTVDYRLLVAMPADVRTVLRHEMQKNLQTLNMALAYIDTNNFEQAAEVVESQMGKSAMRKHKGMGHRPGRYFPEAFREMARSMHSAASDFSQAALTEDPKKIIHSLSVLTSYCSGCHSAMRVQ